MVDIDRKLDLRPFETSYLIDSRYFFILLILISKFQKYRNIFVFSQFFRIQNPVITTIN